jgi:formylglycine-generating enzyme
MKRLAICIGIEAYTHFNNLVGAENDAQEMFNMLIKCKFDTSSKLMRSPHDNDILAKIEEIRAMLDDGDVFLFYIAAHGLTYNNDVFILDPSARNDGAYIRNRKNIIPLSMIISLFANKPKTQQLYIVDTCRTEYSSYRSGVENGTANFSEEYFRDFIEAHGSTNVGSVHQTRIYACASFQKAGEITKLRQGLFTYSLLQVIKTKRDSVAFDDKLIDEVKQTMQAVGRAHGFSDNQFPSYTREGSIITIPAPSFSPIEGDPNVGEASSPKNKRRRKPKRLQPETTTTDGNESSLLTMVKIEGGSFNMGFTDGVLDEIPEYPISQVTVSSFLMSKYPITQKEYSFIMHYDPLEFIGDHKPAHSISWYQAIDFCNKLSILEQLEPVYTCLGVEIVCHWEKDGYRLPTEAEWEYAAKGGLLNSERRYSGSNVLKDVGWFANKLGPSDVGVRKSNSLGLYDMSGNVWEWCWDTYKPYTSDDKINPRCSLKGNNRVLRGGAWYCEESYCTTTYRCPENVLTKNAHIGFRVVRRI